MIGTTLLILLTAILAYLIGKYIANRKIKQLILVERKDAIARSRSVLAGLFSEQLAPYLPDFKYNPNECRFIGKPIDLMIFKGMDGKDIKEVVFLEIKSGNAKLNAVEKTLKEAIDNKRVRWEEYRIPKGVTDAKKM